MIENEDDFKLLLYSQALSPAFGGMIAFVKGTEPLLERGQGQVIWPDDLYVCRLFSVYCADIYFILCTHFYFVYCASRKSLGSDDDFCCGCQNVSDTDNCFQGHSYTKGHTTQRVLCLRPVTDFVFLFRTHSTTCT